MIKSIPASSETVFWISQQPRTLQPILFWEKSTSNLFPLKLHRANHSRNSDLPPSLPLLSAPFPFTDKWPCLLQALPSSPPLVLESKAFSQQLSRANNPYTPRAKGTPSCSTQAHAFPACTSLISYPQGAQQMHIMSLRSGDLGTRLSQACPLPPVLYIYICLLLVSQASGVSSVKSFSPLHCSVPPLQATHDLVHMPTRTPTMLDHRVELLFHPRQTPASEETSYVLFISAFTEPILRLEHVAGTQFSSFIFSFSFFENYKQETTNQLKQNTVV